MGSISDLGRSPGEGNGNPLQYSCLENLHGQRSLVGYSPWGPKESDMTEQLSTVHMYLEVTCLHFWQLLSFQWQPTPVLLPGKPHGGRSLVGCRQWGREESDTTERLHFSLPCIGEGNGNPLQCSCLENPRDGGAWWAAVYGVAQSRTRLKRLSRCACAQSLSRVQLFVTPWTVAYQAPPSMGFSRQECWSGLPFPSPTTRPKGILNPSCS